MHTNVFHFQQKTIWQANGMPHKLLEHTPSLFNAAAPEPTIQSVKYNIAGFIHAAE